METKDEGEVIANDTEDTSETVEETTEEVSEETKETKPEKPKRTPQEELEYFEGRASRLRKKLGVEEKSTESKSSASNKPNELDLGGIAYLNSLVGLKGKDEVALAREYLANGKTVLDLPDNKFFKQDLEALREAKASTDAIPKSSKRSGQTAVTNVDIAIAKYKDTGELPSDFETRNKVVDAITKEESGDMFTGPSVIGPKK